MRQLRTFSASARAVWWTILLNEISLTTLRNTSKTVRAMGRFLHHEAIQLPETRDLIWGATRCKKWNCKRCVTLLDNMACTLALSRARARSSRLFLLVRRSCAIGLACHRKQYFRLIPSEGNPADAPSRVYDRGKFDNKSEGPFHCQNVIVSTGQTTHDEVVDLNASVHQSYVPTSSMTHPCPRPCTTETCRNHGKVC